MTENNAMEIIYTCQTDLSDKRSAGACIAEPDGKLGSNLDIPNAANNAHDTYGALADNISLKRRRVSKDEKKQVAEYLKSNFNSNLDSESVTWDFILSDKNIQQILSTRNGKPFLMDVIPRLFSKTKCDKNFPGLVIKPILSEESLRIDRLAQEVESTLEALPDETLPDSLLISIIFKALEIGTLTMESALKTLQHHGITLRAEYHFQKELQEPMNPDVQTNLSNETENNPPEPTPSNSSLFQQHSAIEDSPIMEPQNPFEFPNLISRPAKSWEAAAKRTEPTDFDKELLTHYVKLLNLTEKSNQLKKIPIYIISYKRAIEHLKEIFIKRLIVPLFGSFDLFLTLLFNLEEVKSKNNLLLEEQVQKRLKEEKETIQKAADAKTTNIINSINKHFQDIALLLLKGCFLSNESYQKLRLLLSFDTNLERAIVLRCPLPKKISSYQKPMSEIINKIVKSEIVEKIQWKNIYLQVMNFLRDKIDNDVAFDTGELSGITEAFYYWMTKLNNRKQGTTMKSFFLSQITITKEQVQEKMLQLGSPRSCDEWKVVAQELNVGVDIPHSWFIIRETYLRMTKLSRRKRKLLKTEGFPFPCLPSVNEVNKLLSSMIIESLDIDPLLNPKEYDQKALEILEQGKIYIGRYSAPYH